MISGGEQIRRLLVFYHALREAHDEFVDRTEREIDRESLDWFQRERFDSAMERHRRVLRAVEEMRLEAAYRGISHDIRDFRGRTTVIWDTVVNPQADRAI